MRLMPSIEPFVLSSRTGSKAMSNTHKNQLRSNGAKGSALIPTPVYDTYWKFAAERQEIFFRRLEPTSGPLTCDPILAMYKFTNAYRASDRVSQYLIRRVIGGCTSDARDIFFRILLFKLFNRIETWETLESAIGELRWQSFDLTRYAEVLERVMEHGRSIYSAAYIMPAATGFKGSRKHETHLRLLQHMLNENAAEKIRAARTMGDAFAVLRGFPMMGDFLAYQFVTDLNYSDLTQFSEMEFVIPGPGARDGIRKCFSSLGGMSEGDVIRIVVERQEMEFDRLGIHFRNLWGRRLQLIDCQNLFCEVDKYARIAHPEFAGRSGRTRIKQTFMRNPTPIEYQYPIKWKLCPRI
jgi:hypothetical protein